MKSVARVQIMKILSKSLVFVLSASLVSPVSVFGAEPESDALPLVRAHAHTMTTNMTVLCWMRWIMDFAVSKPTFIW